MKQMSTNSKTTKEFDILTGRTSKHLLEYHSFFFHPQALSAFKKLQALAKKEINSELQIISSFRSFERQELIWNEKHLGIRSVLNEEGNLLQKENFTEKDFLEKILRFSAIPGSSRHHWGTDLDIYDANELSKDQVELINSECIQGGVFEKIHTWLDEKILKDEAQGFFRPYSHDQGGVSVERWHLSYAPISLILFQQYTQEFFIKNIEACHIQCKEMILKDAQFYFKKYIQNINLPTM